jgi:hypothetical protein
MHEDDKRFQQLSGKCLQLLDYGRNPNNVRTDRPVIGAREATSNPRPEQRKAIALGAMALAVGASVSSLVRLLKRKLGTKKTDQERTIQ